MFVSLCYATGVVNKAGLAYPSGAPGHSRFLVEFVLSVLFSFMCNGFVIYMCPLIFDFLFNGLVAFVS